MRFYIASSLDNAEQVKRVRDLLIEAGHVPSYDWTKHGSVQHGGPTLIAEVARLEANGVADADFVVGLLPGGRGTHVELGMAIALGKRVFLYGPKQVFDTTPHGKITCFYLHPRVEARWCQEDYSERILAQALACILEIFPPRPPVFVQLHEDQEARATGRTP